MAATLSSSGQWTLLATDLTPIKDSAVSGTGTTTGQGATLLRATPFALPAIAAADLIYPNPPPEILAFIQLCAQGFGASFFNAGAINLATPTATLNVLATAKLVSIFLESYLRKALPGHDGIAGRAL